MQVLEFHERKGFGIKVFTQEELAKKVDFPKGGIADKQCLYDGPSPYHLNYCGYEPCEAGYTFGPYRRSSFLIHFVASGSGVFSNEHDTYHLHAGQLFLIYPGETTTYRASMTDPWTYYWVGFSGYQAELILSEMGFTHENPVVTLKKPEKAVACFEKIIRCSDNSLKNELRRTSELLKFFSQSIDTGAKREKVTPKRGTEYAEAAMRYISTNYSQNIQIGELADKIGVVRSYLTKSFTMRYDMSPQEYLIRIRLEHASNYLLNTNMVIADIIERCGFSDVSSFCKLFKKRIGCTPTEYRSQYQDK